MSDADLAAAVDANYWESYTALAGACGGAVLERGEVLAVSTGLPVAMLNIGFIKRPPADAEGSVRGMVEFFDDLRVPFVLRVREGVAPEAEDVMQAMGLPYSDTVPGMAMFPIGDRPAGPDGLSIEIVGDEDALAHYQSVIARGFGMPLDFAERLLPTAFLAAQGFESYLGLVDGEPVATSSLYYGDGTAGVYNVSTLPGQRRRGFGEAVTWHAVERGREHDCSVAILQASAMGKPVYEGMAFRTVAPYRTFHRWD